MADDSTVYTLRQRLYDCPASQSGFIHSTCNFAKKSHDRNVPIDGIFATLVLFIVCPLVIYFLIKFFIKPDGSSSTFPYASKRLVSHKSEGIIGVSGIELVSQEQKQQQQQQQTLVERQEEEISAQPGSEA